MFEMDKVEFLDWRSQFASSKSDQIGLRYAPFCFTEQGVTMLSCILSSKRAIEVNIKVIRVFTSMREAITDTLTLKFEIEEIKKKLSEHGNNIGLVFDYLDAFIHKNENTRSRKQIGYKSE